MTERYINLVSPLAHKATDMRIAGGHGSGFIPVQSVDRNRPQLPGETYSERTGNGSKTVTTLPGGATVTRHKMGGVNE